MIVERFPNLLPSLLVQGENGSAGFRSGEYDQQGTLDQRRRPARHLLYLVFPPNVLLPDNSPCFHVQAVHITIRPNDINPLLLHYRSRCWACPSLGHKSPFQIIFFVAINPKNLARLFLEAMHARPGGSCNPFKSPPQAL